MATSRKSARAQPGAGDVDDFMRKLDHPLKAAMEAVRSIILGVNPEISEGIKWNAPSFCFKEYFATINLRKGVVHVIFHLGAKVKDNSTAGLPINDPTGLLEWLAKERAAVKFRDMTAVRSSRAAFENIVRQWIACMP